MPKLTKTFVDKLADTGADVTHWDVELPGFGVRIQPGGRKTYLVRYRTLGGTQRKMKLGRTSDFPPEKGRDLARKVFAMVAEGKDPRADNAEAKSAPTVRDLEQRYTNEHAKPFKKPKSQRSDEMNWRLYILPALGSKKVREVTEADVRKLFGGLSEKKATANQVLALLSKSLNLAEMWKMRPVGSNPCRGIKKFKINEKELILNPDQIRALNTTLLTMTAAGEIMSDFADFIRLLMLTGCRMSEIMLARAEWIDLHQGLLLLPDTKVGQRRIPLSPWAQEIAQELVKDGREWLIPGRRKGRPLKTPYHAWNRVKKAAGLPMELRLHDLRHTAGSLAHMNGATQKEIQLMLGHKQMSTTERYIHGASGAAGKTVTVLGNVITGAWDKDAA